MTLAVAYADIQAEVSRELGWDRDPTEWSDVQDSDFALIVNSGLRKFYSGEMPGEGKSHNWSFLYPMGELQLTAGYGTGTIDISAGDVTIAGGTWPSWAAEGEIWLEDDTKHEVVSRTSPSVITIADEDITWPALSTYTLRRIHYDLPTDFGGMYTDEFTYRRDEQWHLPHIRILGESDIRRMDRENNGGIYPAYASLVPVAPNLWRARFFPVAESTYNLEYRYKIAPAKLTPSNPYPYGGAYYGEAIVAAVLDAAVQRIHSSNEHHENFLSCMRQAIQHDRRNFSVHTFGQGVRSNEKRGDSLEDFRRSTSISNITTSF